MVAYLRFPPPPSLRDVVEHFWMVEGSGSAEVQRQVLIPNGRPALAIALAEPGFRHDPLTGTQWRNEGSLFGIMTRPHVLSQSGPSSYVGAELSPWGVAALGLSDRLVDAVLPLDDWLGAGTTAGGCGGDVGCAARVLRPGARGAGLQAVHGGQRVVVPCCAERDRGVDA